MTSTKLEEVLRLPTSPQRTGTISPMLEKMIPGVFASH
jgi:hypothetical protein